MASRHNFPLKGSRLLAEKQLIPDLGLRRDKLSLGQLAVPESGADSQAKWQRTQKQLGGSSLPNRHNLTTQVHDSHGLDLLNAPRFHTDTKQMQRRTTSRVSTAVNTDAKTAGPAGLRVPLLVCLYLGREIST